MQDISKFSGITGLWVENKNDRHFFVNLKDAKTWTEYLNGKSVSTYRLHMYDGPNLFLQNINMKSSYVLLTNNGFAKGSLPTVSDQLTPGFWHTTPSFPNSI